MKKKYKIGIVCFLCFAFCALLWFLLHGSDVTVLEPIGIVGLKQRNLFYISTLLMLIIIVPVFILTLYVMAKYHSGNTKAEYAPDWDNSHLAEALWWGVPCIIIVFLSIITWKSSFDLDPYRPLESSEETITIQVVALDWKWLFIYPDRNVASVNYFKFPTNTPLHFQITADAPMNSFWLPKLGGQIFAMSGMETHLYLIADEAGEYFGCSSNISGKGFADMFFVAQAVTKEEYEDWVASLKDAPQLTIDSYKDLAKPTVNHPVSYYNLQQPNLFHWIMMKYMMPVHAH